MSTNKKTVVYPYKKNRVAMAHNANLIALMGRQSQQRVPNAKRRFKNASNSKPKKKKKVVTLQGADAFIADLDCNICSARAS